MKNTYLTSHFPLLAILVYSLAFALYAETFLLEKLADIGLYSGMTEFFSESGIKMTLLFVLFLLFFMALAALKIISDTMIQLSLLFFSKDKEGADLQKIRQGSWFYFISSFFALILCKYIEAILASFVIATLAYLVFYLYKIRDSLSLIGLFGMVLFHSLFWGTFLFTFIYAVTKLYNSFIASLPL